MSTRQDFADSCSWNRAYSFQNIFRAQTKNIFFLQVKPGNDAVVALYFRVLGHRDIQQYKEISAIVQRIHANVTNIVSFKCIKLMVYHVFVGKQRGYFSIQRSATAVFNLKDL